nr:NAD(P)H-dependent oxidoreductase [Serratia nevei]
MNTTHQSKRLVVLVGSPRRDGNSATLAQAILAGAAEAGTSASLHFLDDYLSGFLSDERHTPPPADRYAELFLEHFLPADGAVFCTPIYWYGMSAQTKAFFDRSFSFYSNAYPQAEQVHQRMSGKRIGLAVASEETYPARRWASCIRSRSSAATPIPRSSAWCTAPATSAARSPAIRAIRCRPPANWGASSSLAPIRIIRWTARAVRRSGRSKRGARRQLQT